MHAGRPRYCSRSQRSGATASRSARTSRRPSSAIQRARAHQVHVCLDILLAERGLTLADLSRQTGGQENLSVLENDRARAIRFSILTLTCYALGCTPGELIELK